MTYVQACYRCDYCNATTYQVNYDHHTPVGWYTIFLPNAKRRHFCKSSCLHSWVEAHEKSQSWNTSQ